MRWWSRLLGVVLLVGVLTGCGGAPVPPKPGTPGQKVTVVRGDRTYPLTAEITGWQVRPHPQVPDRGAAVNLTYRFDGTFPEVQVELMVCAVDERRVVLGCGSVHHPGITDQWLGPAENIDLSRTAAVLVFPDQMHSDSNPADPKDFDGYYPPRRPGPGNQL